MTNSMEDPHWQLVAGSGAYLYPIALRAAALLDVAEHLVSGPRDATELAELVGADGPFLRRVLRFLASHGTFREDEDGLFHLTPQADLLRSNVPGSFRSALLLVTSDMWWLAARDFVEAVRHGEPAFDRRFGRPFFDYLATHPEEGQLFSAGMAGFSSGDVGSVVAGYDLPGDGVIVDVGGGRGNLLLAALQARPGLRGVLFDHEKVLADNMLRELGADDRWTLVAGDFFESVPSGDFYLLKNILHDWNDDQCVRILENCRRAMNPGAKILVVEAVIPSGNDPHFGKAMDMFMMLLLTGQERSESEFERLFERAGFRATRVLPTAGPLSMIEVVPA